MDKSTSNKPLNRRSPRTCAARTSSSFLAAKESMKMKMKKNQNDDFIRDDYATAQEAKTIIEGKTGIVYDDKMVKHFCMWDKNYPENPERFSKIIER